VQLEKAIQSEEFEEAAKLSDKIRDFEKKAKVAEE
jgi:protein-arginine kinase activator protein McsA